MPSDIRITYSGAAAGTYTDVLPWEDCMLGVPLDLAWTGGPVEPSDSVPKSIVSVGQVTAVSLLSSPARLQLTYDDGRGSRTATYGPNAMLFVPRANKPARNPSLRATRSIYSFDGWGSSPGGDYWLPVNRLLTAELVAEKI